jgi:glycosyl transferase, family 25
MFEAFDSVVVVNLPERTDRKAETERELAKAGCTKAVFFPAIRPKDAGKFGSIGEHGCYMSHLELLRQSAGRRNILFLEDDVAFVGDFAARSHLIQDLPEDWDVFYGGREQLPDRRTNWDHLGLVKIEGAVELSGTHCYAVNGRAIGKLIAQYETFLSRERGDPRGGPMPVDGALNVARRQLGLQTYTVNPVLAYQRSSRTDIGDRKFFDKSPGLRGVASLLRKAKNRLRKIAPSA